MRPIFVSLLVMVLSFQATVHAQTPAQAKALAELKAAVAAIEAALVPVQPPPPPPPPPVPVNCVPSAWSAWGACVSGSESRSRTIATPASNGGAACVLSETRSCSVVPPPPPPPSPGGLLQKADLVYQGAFRVPTLSPLEQSYSYGGVIAVSPQGLLMVGHPYQNKVGEITIPTLAPSTTLAGLAVATVRQPLTDVLQGHRGDIGGGGGLGGLLPNLQDLIVSAFIYFDASNVATKSHFRAGMNFAALPPVAGPYVLTNNLGKAGYVAGWMAPIPQAWHASLGGDSLTGQGAIPIISRTSLGPSATVFTRATVGTASPIPGTTVLGYTAAHPTLGLWNDQRPTSLFSSAALIGGMVFPDGTRSVLFFGRRGTTAHCYGIGVTNQAAHNTNNAAGEHLCWDLAPGKSAKGNHGYPYETFVWAYDVHDLIAVKQGLQQPWDVVPYATWNLDLPFQHSGRQLNGAAFDAVTRRIYITSDTTDGSRPLVHVFSIQ